MLHTNHLIVHPLAIWQQAKVDLTYSSTRHKCTIDDDGVDLISIRFNVSMKYTKCRFSEFSFIPWYI